MNSADIVMDLVRGKKRLTTALYNRDLSLEEQMYDNPEARVHIRHEDKDIEDLDDVSASYKVYNTTTRHMIPLNFDELRGLDELLCVLSAFCCHGKDTVFRLYTYTTGNLLSVFTVLHEEGKAPKVYHYDPKSPDFSL